MHYRDTDLIDMKKSMSDMTKKLLDGSRNDVISPVSIYRLLMILSAITAGKSKEQVDALLGKKSIPENILEDIFDVDEHGTFCSISDSVWANESFDISDEKLNELKSSFDCDVFTVPVGEERTDAMIREWINEKTKDFLKEQTGSIRTHVLDAAVLYSAIYLKSAWHNTFKVQNNVVEYFTDVDGKKTKCEFMCEQGIGRIYKGSCFTAVCKQMTAGLDMFMLLPDEEIKLENMLKSEDLYDLVYTTNPSADKKCYVITRLPKFDVSAHNSLTEMLIDLGITDIFDSKKADFSPFVRGEGFYISEADQAARVKIDEEGLEGAASTRTVWFGCFDPFAGVEMEVIKFYLDRPFAFFVRKEGIPVFAGTITMPLETDKEYTGGKEIDFDAILNRLKRCRESIEDDDRWTLT